MIEFRWNERYLQLLIDHVCVTESRKVPYVRGELFLRDETIDIQWKFRILHMRGNQSIKDLVSGGKWNISIIDGDLTATLKEVQVLEISYDVNSKEFTFEGRQC